MNAPRDPSPNLSDDVPDPADAPEVHLPDALARLDEAAAGGPLPDAARISAHLAGVGDAALLDDAAIRPDVRRLLSDVAWAEEAGDPARRDLAPLPLKIRARALAAWSEPDARHSTATEADALVTSDSTHPERTAGGRVLSLWSSRARVAAALLVVAVPVALLMLLAGRVEAAPALAIDGIERVDLSGTVAAEGVRSLPVGRHIAPGPSERVSVLLAGGSRVVLGAGDDVRVACDDASCKTAALALDRGDIVLSATLAGPVTLLLPGGGRLEVVEGDVHVAQGRPEPGSDASSPSHLALRAGAKARWTPSGSSQPSSFSGPRSWVLNAWSGSVLMTAAATAAPSEDLFRDLLFFGGKVEEAPSEGVVSARQWRIVRRAPVPPGASTTAPRAGGASVRESDAAGVPAIRMDLQPGAAASLAWRPSGAALLTSRVEVLLRFKSAKGTPSAAPAARLTVSLDGAKGSEAEVEIPADATKPVRAAITVPDGWGAAEETLVFSCSGSPVTVWFEGIAFRGAGDAGRAPLASAE